MVELIFRELVHPDDITTVGAILSATGFFNREEQEVGISLVEEHLHKGTASGYLFLFAEERDKIQGYTCYGPIPGTLNGFDLYWIAVEPTCWHRGIGRILLAETEKRVLALGGLRLYAETASNPQYKPTRDFYERNGFSLEGRLADYYAPHDDKMLYVKHLNT
jgi:GNAT superfamily N-acetyltransferase